MSIVPTDIGTLTFYIVYAIMYALRWDLNRIVPAKDNPSIAQIELETAMMLDKVYVSISIPTTMKNDEGRNKTVWQPVLQYLPFVCGHSALRELVDWLDRIAPDHDLDGYESGHGIVSLVLRLDQEPTERQIKAADTVVLYAQARSPWASATKHITAA